MQAILAAVLAVGMAQSPAIPQGSPLAGDWMGTLAVPGGKLRIVFHIAAAAGGAGGYSGTLDSPDQGASGIAASEVTLKASDVHIGVAVAAGSFDGKLNGSHDEIAGTWKQGGAELPLTLKRMQPGDVKALARPRPQEPKPPFPYVSRQVRYANKAAGIELAGTLTIPRGKAPFPAVVLITGSGPQDRNEALAGHKPFLVLADYLTRRGIAVLRVDDRGVGGSGGRIDQSTTADFVGDVLAGVSYLKSEKEIDPHRIGLIGHSEGGIVAPMAAARSKDVAFIVMMAGTGVTGARIIELQAALIARKSGASEQDISKAAVERRKAFDIVESGEDSAAAARRLRALYESQLAGMSEEERKKPEHSEAVFQAQSGQLLSPWFRYFLTLDPVPYLQRVKCPVLAINGERDLQVPPKDNLPIIRQALKAGGNRDYIVEELPGLNHLFQACKTGLPTEYAQIEETISPSALKVIGDWIVRHTSLTAPQSHL